MVADKVFSGLFTVCRDTFVCYIQWVNTSSPCARVLRGLVNPWGRAGLMQIAGPPGTGLGGRFGAHKVPQKPIWMT